MADYPETTFSTDSFRVSDLELIELTESDLAILGSKQ
jgi:hypothetical protein